MHHSGLILIVGVAVLLGCSGRPPTTQHVILAEGIFMSDGLSISSGNVVVVENQPGIAFATVTIPKEPKRIAYFLVFNQDQPIADVKSEGRNIGSRANTSHTINTFGNACMVEYEVALKEGTESIEIERVSISDKKYDTSKGRLFLIDMETTPPSITQINLDLPTNVPALNEPESTRQFGHDTLNAFRKADETVNGFCRTIETKDK